MSDDDAVPDQRAEVLAARGSGWAFDLIAVAVLSVVTAVLVGGSVLPGVVGWIVGVPFLIFYPGYAAIAAVFPERSQRLNPTEVRPKGPPSFLARVTLSLVVSPVIVGLLATALSPLGAIELGPVVVGVTVLTLGLLVAATIRRLQLPVHLRAGPSPTGLGSPLGGGIPGNSVQSLAFVLAALALVGVSIAAVAIPPTGEAYTEAYLLTEEDGEFVADGLPADADPGETAQFHVGIANHENGPTDYEAVTVVQEVDPTGDVATQTRADGFSVTLADDEEAIESQSFTAAEAGGDERLRVRVLVFEGSAPEEPTAGTADQVLQFYLDGED